MMSKEPEPTAIDIIRHLNRNLYSSILTPNIIDPEPLKTCQYKNNLFASIIHGNASKTPEKQRLEIFKLLAYDPTNHLLYYLLGSLFKMDNLLDQARSFFRISLHYNPKHIDSYLDLATIFHKTDNPLAIKILEHALTISPDDHRVMNTLAVCYADHNRYEDAEKMLLKIPRITTNNDNKCEPSNNDVQIKSLINLGVIVSSMGQNEKAIKYLEEAEQLAKISGDNEAYNQAHIGILQNKLLIANNTTSSDPNDSEYDLQIQDLKQNSNKNKYEYALAEHLKINNSFNDKEHIIDNSDPLKPITKFIDYVGPNTNLIKERLANRPNKKLRIGYVSFDLRNHVISKFMMNILNNHDTDQFDIFIYYTYKLHDQITVVLRKVCQSKNITWVECCTSTDIEIAQHIFKNEIDVLFDLNGHTEGNRLGIFKLKPAPVQITYLGYPNTTGLFEMDYRITDSIADNIETKQLYSEKLLRLAGCFITYHPLIYNINTNNFFDISVEWSKKSDDPIIFGAINRPAKNNPELLKTWSRILKEIPHSKFLIKVKNHNNEDVSNKNFIKYYMDALDVPEDRLILVSYQESNDAYFQLFNKVDILLDTFPYSGTTTTCDALYMSVPVITLYNKNCHSQNVSASILTSIGLHEFVAKDIDDYINIAKRLANPQIVCNYRNKIRDQFIKFILAKDFIKDFERIIRVAANIDITNNSKTIVKNI